MCWNHWAFPRTRCCSWRHRPGGQTPQYLNTNGFSGLHGRALPPAVAAKMVNPGLTVIVDSGDGDSYGEGGNHFIHNIRRNVDITHFVHDNQIYGLTKGQASPTSAQGHVTHVQTYGSANVPMNPLLTALAMGAGFVARGFSGDKEQLAVLMKAAIAHRGYALVDILQPCVSFNKINTFAWYKSRVYHLDETHDKTSLAAAMEKAMEWGDSIPTGILYQVDKPVWPDHIPHLREGKPLVERPVNADAIKNLVAEFT
jgi:2-oxoglutarate ferredoxin oxidoreductase subunit beta